MLAWSLESNFFIFDRKSIIQAHKEKKWKMLNSTPADLLFSRAINKLFQRSESKSPKNRAIQTFQKLAITFHCNESNPFRI